MAKFPGQLAGPPLSIPLLSRRQTSTLPALHRNVTTPKTSSPLRLVFFLELFQQRLCFALSCLLALQDEAPLQLPTISGSPPASDRPPGLAPLVLIQLPTRNAIVKASFLRDPFDRQSWRSWLVACAAVPNTGENMEYMPCCVVHLLRIAASPLH